VLAITERNIFYSINNQRSPKKILNPRRLFRLRS
jgi:hypothetical protein